MQRKSFRNRQAEDAMPHIDRILIATRNAGKIREIAAILGRHGIETVTLADLLMLLDVEETGATFLENAAKKASEYSAAAGMYSLAEDSGLEVAALGGRPGVLSARYAGESSDYETKIRTLLAELDEAASDDRSARFVCSMAFADPAGEVIWTIQGICEGEVAASPRGANGFGYDPIFKPVGFAETFGELDDDVKRSVSHRAKATDSFMRFFLDFIGG